MNQPLYVIKIGQGYYSALHCWQEVSIEQADRLTHQEARRICSRLHKYYKNATFVKAPLQ